jgi:hypothetical protein
MKKILTMLLVFLSAATAVAAPLDFTDLKNDREANLATIKFMEGMGLDIAAKSDESFMLNFGGYKILISPNVGKNNGDFIIGYVSFGGVGKSNVSSSELALLINRINSKFNYLTACIDNDGDIVVRYYMPFDKKLEPKLILKWLGRIEIQTDQMAKEFSDDLTKFLR